MRYGLRLEREEGKKIT